MAQNTHWTDDGMRRADNGGTTIVAVVAVIVVLGIVYLAAHGWWMANRSPNTEISGPSSSVTTTDGAPNSPLTSPNSMLPNAPMSATPSTETPASPPAATDLPAAPQTTQ